MSRAVTVSLCLIARDEEDYIQDCIRSVSHLVDEVILVDTGSRDETANLAREAGARVFFHRWENDFALARNHGLGQAASEWILVLDADEILEPVKADEFGTLLAREEVAGYFLKVKSYLGSGRAVRWDRVVRLFGGAPDYRPRRLSG